MTTLLLVDDHALIRQGLRTAFEQAEDFVVVGEAASLSEALALDRALQPQVLVVDINLGDGSGLDLVRQVRAERPETGVVVLTMYDDDSHLLAALDAGSSCFVLKQAPVQEVVKAARQALAAPGAFSAAGLAAVMRRKMAAPTITLTTRENQILQLLAQGLSVAEVSQQLFVSASTTKTHMAKVYDKLGATNRTQAVMNAVRLGLVTVEV